MEAGPQQLPAPRAWQDARRHRRPPTNDTVRADSTAVRREAFGAKEHDAVGRSHVCRVPDSANVAELYEFRFKF